MFRMSVCFVPSAFKRIFNNKPMANTGLLFQKNTARMAMDEFDLENARRSRFRNMRGETELAWIGCT
jgi:hypothetical protein